MRRSRAPFQRARISFRTTLAPGLKGRFGDDFAKVNMYPVPILTRDTAGYFFKHTDRLWKGITVQFYLPADNSTQQIGTIFHEALPNGRNRKRHRCHFRRIQVTRSQ